MRQSLYLAESRPSQAVVQCNEHSGNNIIGIYGFNFSILTGLFVTVFSRIFGRWCGAVLAALAIACYAMLVGG